MKVKTEVLNEKGSDRPRLKKIHKKRITKIETPIRKKRISKVKKAVRKKKELIINKKSSRKININFSKIKPTNKEYEIWNVKDNWFKIYVKDKEVALALSKFLNAEIAAIYMDEKMKQFAWDLSFDKSRLKEVKKICKEVLE